ncbi:GDSL esterase/lipase 4-like [Chenopodium quinoa]|nr:GDSL esterase/lipase 4-like [Chenopodium quinoa]
MAAATTTTARSSNILPTLYATLLIVSLTTCNAKNLLYVFGDSLFDAGMTLYTGVAGDGAEFWPYGRTYFKKPAGRYCDGRVIPDFLAEYAGWPHLQPYLQPGFDDYTKGTSFAAASACVLVETRPGKINLALQMYYFVQMVRKLKQQVGESEGNKLLSKAVYLIDIGGNDYFSIFEPNKTNLPQLPLNPQSKKAYVNLILSELTTHIYTLYNKGARKFAFPNIGPLGHFPSMKTLCMLRPEKSCLADLDELARMHNAAFAKLANKLQKRLPGFKYSIYDFYTAVDLRVLNAYSYGFKESITACCGSGMYNGDFTCQKTEHSFSACSNPPDYLWFDAGHPTEKANQQFAYEMWSGGLDVVAPYNLKSLLAMS